MLEYDVINYNKLNKLISSVYKKSILKFIKKSSKTNNNNKLTENKSKYKIFYNKVTDNLEFVGIKTLDDNLYIFVQYTQYVQFKNIGKNIKKISLFNFNNNKEKYQDVSEKFYFNKITDYISEIVLFERSLINISKRKYFNNIELHSIFNNLEVSDNNTIKILEMNLFELDILIKSLIYFNELNDVG